MAGRVNLYVYHTEQVSVNSIVQVILQLKNEVDYGFQIIDIFNDQTSVMRSGLMSYLQKKYQINVTYEERDRSDIPIHSIVMVPHTSLVSECRRELSWYDWFCRKRPEIAHVLNEDKVILEFSKFCESRYRKDVRYPPPIICGFDGNHNWLGQKLSCFGIPDNWRFFMDQNDQCGDIGKIIGSINYHIPIHWHGNTSDHSRTIEIPMKLLK